MNLLFVINNMHFGGTRSSMLSLFESLKEVDSVSIDLLVLSHEGELMDAVPSNVCLIQSNRFLHAVFADKRELIKISEKALRAVVHLSRICFGYDTVYPYIYRRAAKQLNLGEYDAVIGYQQGDACDMAAAIQANKHILWIHSPYSKFKDLKEYFELVSSYETADHILFVANSSMEDFLISHPEYRGKTSVIKNTINYCKIKKLSKYEDGLELFDKKHSKIRLVTVGRVSKEKGYERIIDAAKILLDAGCSFEWVVIGGGEGLSELKEKCISLMIDKSVIFIGGSGNPYSIMASADAFVSTSYYESQPLVLIESLILGVPVVTTNFDSCTELTKGKEYAVVVENSVEGIVSGIKELFKDGKLDTLKKAASGYTYNNEEIIQQFLDICKM